MSLNSPTPFANSSVSPVGVTPVQDHPQLKGVRARLGLSWVTRAYRPSSLPDFLEVIPSPCQEPSCSLGWEEGSAVSVQPEAPLHSQPWPAPQGTRKSDQSLAGHLLTLWGRSEPHGAGPGCSNPGGGGVKEPCKTSREDQPTRPTAKLHGFGSPTSSPGLEMLHLNLLLKSEQICPRAWRELEGVVVVGGVFCCCFTLISFFFYYFLKRKMYLT